jgi:transposase
MPAGKRHDPKIRNNVLSAIKSGMTQTEAANLYSVSPKTVSTWCRQDVVGGEKNYLTQINQLKRELDNAYRVIGKLSAHADRPKG